MLEDLFGAKGQPEGQSSSTKGVGIHPQNISCSPDHRSSLQTHFQTPPTSSQSSCCSSPSHTNIDQHATLPATISSLYTSDSGIPRPIFKVSDKIHCFRLVILQDAGIRKKQTLFDSALGITGTMQNRPNPSMYQKLNKSLYHSMNELSTYMFGYYGILMSEAYSVIKMHYLPGLPSMPHSILVTRMFSLDSTFETITPHNDRTSSDWNPSPCEDFADYPFRANNSTRFGIGFVIPAGSDFRSVVEEITDNWKEISHHLILIQTEIIKQLKKNFKPQTNRSHRTNQSLTYGYQLPASAVNKSMSSRLAAFPSYFLQSNFQLNRLFHSLVMCIQHLVDIPRLFIDLHESDQELIEWSSTVASWLELKDGSFSASEFPVPFEDRPTALGSGPHLKFLASLISALLPERESIFKSAESLQMKKSCRVVILTANPMVSEKLIFIIAGLLGYRRYTLPSKDTLPDETSNINSNLTSSRSSSSSSFSSLSEESSTQTPSLRRRNVELSEPRSSLSVSFSHDKVMPISIRSKASVAGLSLEGSTPSDSSSTESGIVIGKCFPPSNKPMSQISSSPTVRALSTVTAKRISIPQLHKESSYASLQNISSSYGGPHQATLGSSSSWRSAFNFGSFMEHWKFGSLKSRAVSGFNSPSRPEFPFGGDRTPSPMAEYSEFPWKAAAPGISLSRTHTNNNSSSSSPHSPGLLFEHPITKTSSAFNKMFHTYNAKHQLHVPRTTTKLTGPSSRQLEFVKRSMSTILNSDLSLEYETTDEHSSVLIVNFLHDDDDVNEPNVPSDKGAKLPPLVGYIDRYVPEFTLMSCPQTPNVNNMIVESMYDDVDRIGRGSRSDTYVVNLRQREIKRITVKYPRAAEYASKPEHSLELPSPSKLSTDLKKSQPVSRLTDVLQKSVLQPKVSILFSPLSQGGKRGYEGESPAEVYADTSIPPFVEHIDHVLNKISHAVNKFLCIESRDREPSTAHSASTFVNGKCSIQQNASKETCCRDLRCLLRNITN